ncbi:MAG: hypothetical protein Kow0092_13520 [Deferrisomatales bacterium]
METSVGWVRAILAAAILVLALGGGAVAGEVGGPSAYRDVTGRVVDDATGAPVAGAVVSLLQEITVADEAGRFRFEKVPVSHLAEVSLRVQGEGGLIVGCITVDVPARFYPLAATADDGRMALEVVEPGAGEPAELRLRPLPQAQVSSFCGGCHEPNPCLETASYEEVVRSDKDLRGIIVPEKEIASFKKALEEKGLRKETYVEMRYQDTHPDGMNMEAVATLDLDPYRGRYRIPEALPLVEGKFVTCDTCHTRHVPTEHKRYVRLPFESESALCVQCHL